LAEQHFRNLRSLLTDPVGAEADGQLPTGVLEPHQVRLLVGATPEAEKEEIRLGLANGEIMLVIGTHALIEEPVVFADLELTIVDEQHRFGWIAQSGAKPRTTHLLVMTAPSSVAALTVQRPRPQ
jgi:ATP-dependent DNA helicase RecG